MTKIAASFQEINVYVNHLHGLYIRENRIKDLHSGAYSLMNFKRTHDES